MISPTREPQKVAPAADGDGVAKKMRDLDQWFDGAWQHRESMLPWWRPIARNLLPRALDFGDGQRSGSSLRARTSVIDRTATHALRIATAGLLSGMSPPWRRWWSQEAPSRRLNQLKPVREFLDAATDVGHDVALRAGYYTALLPVYQDELAFGTGTLIIFETDDDNLARCEHVPVGSYSLTRNAAGRVDGFVRLITMTVAQMAEQFGLARLSGKLQVELTRSPQTTHIIRHAIIKRTGKLDRFGARSLPWADLYWEAPEQASGGKGSRGGDLYSPKPVDLGGSGNGAQRAYLAEGGFHEFPVVSFCWGRIQSDVFGTECPAMDALEDILTLQDMRRDGMNARKKAIDPPVQVPAGMEQTPISYMASGRTVLPAGSAASQGIRDLHEKSELDLRGLMDDVIDVRQMIKDAFFYNIFAAVLGDTSLKTATEVLERRREQMQMLGPVQERNTRDGHDLAIARIMAIVYRRAELDWVQGRAGILPLPPQELQGLEPLTTYRSEVALAQRQDSLAAYERHMQSQLAIAPVVPSVLDGFDWDEAMREQRNLLGIPERFSIAPDVLAAERQARAQVQQLQAAAQAAPGVARAARDLGETKYDEDSILARAS